NFRGAILPETGGSGTTPYIAAGTTLMAAAYVIHRMRRRRGEGRA
ncbi:TPA: LPXTG cell wall anchor domain-containing protein, partial [Clostridioides difficile]|nr:LPXTG cell wall anchor domain-containing protein [Clostridioides difficile]